MAKRLTQPRRHPRTSDECWDIICEIDARRQTAEADHARLCGGHGTRLYGYWTSVYRASSYVTKPSSPRLQEILRRARALGPVSVEIDERRFNGLGWRDMGGACEIIKKCNYSLYTHGLYDPAADKDTRSKRFATYGRLRAAKNPFPS
jgi:hypothetical protein